MPLLHGQQYALRLDYERGSDRDILSGYLDRYSSRYLVVFETASDENPHVHCIFWSESKLAALRKAFKERFPSKVGNGAYSLKECDASFDDYVAYMCKGKSKDDAPVVEMRMGLEYTDEALEDAHNRYWVVNAEIGQRKRARYSEKLGIVEAVEKLAKEKGLRPSERSEIAKIYIRLKKESKRGISIFQARSVVNTVALLLDDTGNAEEELALEIARFA